MKDHTAPMQSIWLALAGAPSRWSQTARARIQKAITLSRGHATLSTAWKRVAKASNREVQS